MTTEIALTLAIILAALLLFATERLRVDLVALLVLLSVGLLRLTDPEEIFAGIRYLVLGKADGLGTDIRRTVGRVFVANGKWAAVRSSQSCEYVGIVSESMVRFSADEGRRTCHGCRLLR